MSNEFPFRREPDFHYAFLLGGNAIMNGMLLLLPWCSYGLLTSFKTMGNVVVLFLVLHTITCIGLIVIGALVLLRFRFLFLLLLPLSIIGLISVPFGTILYFFYLKGFWGFRKLFYPFDRKKGDEH